MVVVVVAMVVVVVVVVVMVVDCTRKRKTKGIYGAEHLLYAADMQLLAAQLDVHESNINTALSRPPIEGTSVQDIAATAWLAQLVERQPFKLVAVGSSPTSGTNIQTVFFFFFHFSWCGAAAVEREACLGQARSHVSAWLVLLLP